MQVKRSLLVELPAERIFDIVERAEEYPEFIPWCADATILERDDGIVDARIGVDYHGLRFTFRTRNPKERPHWLEVRMVDGPFRRFDGVWRFTPLSPNACKIEFGLQCEISDFFVGRLASPVFNRVTDALVDAFIRRAEREHARASVPVPAPALAAVPAAVPAAEPVPVQALPVASTDASLAPPKPSAVEAPPAAVQSPPTATVNADPVPVPTIPGRDAPSAGEPLSASVAPAGAPGASSGNPFSN
jgi:ribosome-associated toxin RatA of RatAB toxin-antitoxin module